MNLKKVIILIISIIAIVLGFTHTLFLPPDSMFIIAIAFAIPTLYLIDFDGRNAGRKSGWWMLGVLLLGPLTSLFYVIKYRNESVVPKVTKSHTGKYDL